MGLRLLVAELFCISLLEILDVSDVLDILHILHVSLGCIAACSRVDGQYGPQL